MEKKKKRKRKKWDVTEFKGTNFGMHVPDSPATPLIAQLGKGRGGKLGEEGCNYIYFKIINNYVYLIKKTILTNLK